MRFRTNFPITHNNRKVYLFWLTGKWGAHHGDWRETDAAFAKEVSKMCFTTESKAKAEKCWKFIPWAPGIRQNTSRRCGKPLPEEQQMGLNLARFVLPCPGKSTQHQSSHMWIISESYKVPTEVWLLRKTKIFLTSDTFLQYKKIFPWQKFDDFTFQTSIIWKHSSMTTLSIKLSPWKQTYVSHNIIHFSQFFQGWSLSANSPLRKLCPSHSCSSDSLARFRDENPNMDHSDESKMTDDRTGRRRKNVMIDFYQTEYSLDCCTAGLGVCNG